MTNTAWQQLTVAFSPAIVCPSPLYARRTNVLLFLEDAFLPMHLFFLPKVSFSFSLAGKDLVFQNYLVEFSGLSSVEETVPPCVNWVLCESLSWHLTLHWVVFLVYAFVCFLKRLLGICRIIYRWQRFFTDFRSMVSWKKQIWKGGCVQLHFGVGSILVIFDPHVLLSTPLATRKVCQTSCHLEG